MKTLRRAISYSLFIFLITSFCAPAIANGYGNADSLRREVSKKSEPSEKEKMEDLMAINAFLSVYQNDLEKAEWWLVITCAILWGGFYLAIKKLVIDVKKKNS